MLGNKGLAIVITALLITVCFGYLFNAEETETTATVYKDQADMGAVFYANSSRTSGTSVYNAPVNVTGWTPTEIIPQSSTANQYVIQKGTVTYGSTVNSTNWMSNTGKSYTTTSAVSGGTWYYSTNTDVRYLGGDTLNNGEPLHGGTSYPQGGNIRLEYQLNGTSYDTGDKLYFINVSELWDYTDKDYIILSNGPNYYLDCEYTAEGEFFNGGITVNFTGTPLSDEDHAIYDQVTETWLLYDDQDNRVGSASNIYIVTDEPGEAWTLQYKPFESETATVYADPTKLVTMTTSTSASWSSGNLALSRVSMLVTTPSASGHLNINAIFPLSNNQFSAHTEGVVYNSGDQLKFDVGVNNAPSIVIGSVDNFKGLLLDFDYSTHIITVTGILSFDVYAPRTNYTLAGNSYSIAMNDYGQECDIVKGYRFTANDGVITVKAAIVETEVVTDPKGVLWNDYSVTLTDYYPQYINADNLGVRVQLGGFVSYGESLTINGQVFTVTDGKITVTLTDGTTARQRDMRISGLAIDYRSDGHVYLVFTESLNRESDLGERVNYTLAGAGSWYFSAHLNTIEETNAQAWTWSTDWSLDSNSTCALYIGFLIVGLILGLYFGRGTFGLYDWIILALAGVIAFSLMVV